MLYKISKFLFILISSIVIGFIPFLTVFLLSKYVIGHSNPFTLALYIILIVLGVFYSIFGIIFLVKTSVEEDTNPFKILYDEILFVYQEIKDHYEDFNKKLNSDDE